MTASFPPQADAGRLGMPTVDRRDSRCAWEDDDGNEAPEPDWAKRFRETGEKPPVSLRRAG